ncbi:S9 family peptidase [Brevundimonas nasdae]|uniref:Prolyl oligopeptidase family serine peptidase n=1 Tax=Brevundimonas nasdae TaxID=172043 RepID=A0ABX8TN38_9CAUL|nr:prolyl oligopeptidase family serine peptidase [Brevundimonas nasdae]QYC11447.1 prolyl oligopeptidase family serine peptidase [Brevundimonas nasdae]QYC14235.1 prolyl oligopeptidase family serine peptidase [Brevundimonas nasdae]
MVVYRVTSEGWALGVLEPSTGRTIWFDISPETANLGRALAWRTDTELLVVARSTENPPFKYRAATQHQARARHLWAEAAAGRTPSVVVQRSGSDRNARPRWPARRLVSLDVTQGIQRVLATGEFVDLELAPNGDHLALLEDAEDIQPDPDQLAAIGEPMRRRRLVLIDLVACEVRRNPDLDLIPYLLSWNPAGDQLLVFARPGGKTWDGGSFRLVTPNGDVRSPTTIGRPALLEGVGRAPYVRAAWDGADAIGLFKDGDGLVWRALDEVGPAAPGTGQDRLITVGGRLYRRDNAIWFPLRGDGVAFSGEATPSSSASDGGGRAAVNPGRLDVQPLMMRTSTGCLVAFGSDVSSSCQPLATTGRLIAAAKGYAVTLSRSPAGVQTLRLEGEDGDRTLAVVNAGLAERRFGEIRPIPHAAIDGTPLTSWLLSPPHPTGPPPPVVALIYPGRAYGAAPAWLAPGGGNRVLNPQVLAAAGYAVLVISLPDASPSDLSRLAGAIEEVLEAAARVAPIDLDRVALAGHSFGGYGALLAATQTTRFRAIVASSGKDEFSDNFDLSGPYRLHPEDGVPLTAMAGWAETGQADLQAFIADDPEAYLRASPLYAARRIVSPVMIFDYDLDFTHADSLFGALYRLDRDAVLVTYLGENHGLVSPANVRDAHARVIDWLDRHLGMATAEAVDPGLSPDLQQRQEDHAAVVTVPDQPLWR